MRNIYLASCFICCAALLSFSTNAAPLAIKNLKDCQTLAAQIKANSFPKSSSNPIDAVKERYTLVKKFSVGKGGAYVAIVEDKSEKGKQKVIKIFPSIAVEDNKYNYRELYYSCINSFISYKDLGIQIDKEKKDDPFMAFPHLFEVGATSAPTYDDEGSNLVYPYMISEYVQGDSLTDLGSEAKKNLDKADYINSSQYNLFNKNQKQAASDKALLMNKDRTQYVLYQIAQILYNLKRLRIEGKEYGFYHADLNAGNIMIRKNTFSGSFDAGYGSIKASHIPLVTFIDFGHATSNLDDNLGPQVKSLMSGVRSTLHFMSASLEDFYKNLNNSDLGRLTEAAIAATTTDADIRFYRTIARALFDSNNYVNKPLMMHLNDCTTRAECVQKAPKLFEQTKK